MHMTGDQHGGACGRHRDELLLLACGDVSVSECSAATLGHLSLCADCRESLAEMRDLTAFVAAEFEAAPLDAEFELSIFRALPGRSESVRPVIGRRLSGAGFAVAAGLTLALLIPLNERPSGAVPRLTEEESAELAVVYASFEWSGPVELSIGRADRTIDEIYRALERGSDADSVLPWALGDDWDAPAEEGGDPSSRIGDGSLMEFCTLIGVSS